MTFRAKLYPITLLIAILHAPFCALFAQTIAEKKTGLNISTSDLDAFTQQELKEINREANDRQNLLRTLYGDALRLYDQGAPPQDFEPLLSNIRAVREQLQSMQIKWREAVTDVDKGDAYALWDQPDTTVEQLVMDYGSQSYIYIIPPDIGKISLSTNSQIPIPRAFWGETLELILEQNGIGVQQLNPYLRILYLLKDQHQGISAITQDRAELDFLPRQARVAFVLSPDPADLRRIAAFLDRFVNPATTSFFTLGRDLLLVSSVAEMQELLKLYDFIAKTRGNLEYKLIPLTKVDTTEMANILGTLFEQFSKAEQAEPANGEKRIVSQSQIDAWGLKVIPLTQVAQAIFLLGTREEIYRAERLVHEIEDRLKGARGKVVFTYRVKHSDPEELAQLLMKIYSIFSSELIEDEQNMMNGGVQVTVTGEAPQDTPGVMTVVTPPSTRPQRGTIYSSPFPTMVDDSVGFYQAGAVVVAPAPITMAMPVERAVNVGRDNFLVDPTTGIIVMVVEPHILPRMKEVIKRLDVPRRMVQLDVLLFEKRNSSTNNFGLNLLRIGSCATNAHTNCLSFNDVLRNVCTGACIGPNPIFGILNFMISRPGCPGVPAYDLAYRFLMTQEDVTINANPSVTTLNQTPAQIAVVEEISINTGVVQVQSAGGIDAKDAFTRAQYGTNIVITPTIHMSNEGDEEFWDDAPNYVTLDTQVSFDTVSAGGSANRPNVVRRSIKNQMRVPDGKTVILGGLRRKDSLDAVSKIPFLGEIPGIGTLFRDTLLSENSQEMFIFITPSIIDDPCTDFERLRREQLARRPGDIPEFLCALDRARKCAQECAFRQGMQILMGGRALERCIPWGDDSCTRDPLAPRLFEGGCINHSMTRTYGYDPRTYMDKNKEDKQAANCNARQALPGTSLEAPYLPSTLDPRPPMPYVEPPAPAVPAPLNKAPNFTSAYVPYIGPQQPIPYIDRTPSSYTDTRQPPLFDPPEDETQEPDSCKACCGR